MNPPSQNLLDRAVLNNALWCDAVCRTHGLPGRFVSDLWIQDRVGPRFYPNVVTLSRSLRTLSALPRIGGVKDSYASMDLEGEGYRRGIVGRWLAREGATTEEPADFWESVTSADELAIWESAWDEATLPRVFLPSLLAEPGVRIWQIRQPSGVAAGAISFDRDGVVGITNLFGLKGPQARSMWENLIGTVTAAHPGRALVGWEPADGTPAWFEAGFFDIGPMCVWFPDSP